MYEYLKGEFVSSTLNAKVPSITTVVIEGGGFGYAVLMPTRCVAESQWEPGQEIVVYLHHSIDINGGGGIVLTGLPSRFERDIYNLLLGVNKVGRSTAIAILHGLPLQQLIHLVVSRDVTGLSRVKGVGKKTAEMIIVAISDKVGSLSPPSLPQADGISNDESMGEVRHYLSALAFTQKEIEDALNYLSASSISSVEEMISSAIGYLS